MVGKKWQTLKKGDIVDIIAPAYGIDKTSLEESLNYIRGLGLIPNVPDDLIGEDLLHSNSDEIRLKHLKNALNSDSKAIWCIRGGYGTAKLVNKLVDMEKPANNKLVIGFSDITALHLFVNNVWNWSSLHAPLLYNMVEDKISQKSKEELTNLLFGRSESQKFELASLNNHKINRLESTIIGGNLVLLQNSIGTSWQPDINNKILLIEDVDEEAHRIDRILEHIKQAKLLNSVKAIIIGDFILNENHQHFDNANLEKINMVLEKFAQSIGVAVFKINGVGHGKINRPIALNTNAVIENDVLTVDNGFYL